MRNNPNQYGDHGLDPLSTEEGGPKILVSACLMGLNCRYDGKAKPSPRILEHAVKGRLIPFCPEELGGLPTPRSRADIEGGTGHDVLQGQGRVMDEKGKDVTAKFLAGAHESLRIAREEGAAKAFLKGGSPSCGVHRKLGVTAALLISNGIDVEEID